MYQSLILGDYRVGIKFNDQHIPDSPYSVYIMPPAGDANKIEIGQYPDPSTVKMNKPVTMAVLMNGAKGNLDAKLITPSGSEDDCFVLPLDAGKSNFSVVTHFRC